MDGESDVVVDSVGVVVPGADWVVVGEADPDFATDFVAVMVSVPLPEAVDDSPVGAGDEDEDSDG